MKPNEMLWLLGYNNLALILEQERRHWLMKTDKNKQVQSKTTGDIFQGKIDNIGTDVIIESKKLPYKYDFISDIQLRITSQDSDPNNILSISKSAFPHSEEVNGLMMSVVKSINFMIDGSSEYHTYKLKFSNADEVVIPFGIGNDIDGVIATKWIKTTTPPTIEAYDRNTSSYSITRTLTFESNVTNPVWYYPIDETLQPFTLTNLGSGNYETAALTDNSCIGYPLFWFTCDNSAVGTNVSYTGDATGKRCMYVGNYGTETPFNGYVYTGLTSNCSPDSLPSSNVTISVSPASGSFNGDDSDYLVPLSNVIKFNQSNVTINFDPTGNNVLTMSNEVTWTYNSNDGVYEVAMSMFDDNNVDNVTRTPLIPMLNVSFNSNVPFVKTTFDEGMSGIKVSASVSNENKYPYDLNLITGLPEWMNDLGSEGVSPESLIAYAYHVPAGSGGNPNDLQGAGLIVDPGLLPGEDVSTNDTKGRVYVLSNDSIEYENNATAEYPKPARTAARICDIPTTIFDFDDATIESDVPIVDKKYTRTEASFTEEAKDILYNKLQSRWVRPTACNSGGIPICDVDPDTFSGKFAFIGENQLNQVDMYHENNKFRYTINLNPMVEIFRTEDNPSDPSNPLHFNNVTIHSITNGGSGYSNGDTGVCVVGGFSFTYIVTSVAAGSVATCDLLFNYDVETIPSINISNFDNLDYSTGLTSEYSTSPYDPSSSGTGLRFILRVDPTYLATIIPKRGEFFPDLFALVRTGDGLYAYKYKINESSISVPKPGTWVKDIKLSEYESDTTSIADGGLSTRNSYLNSIIPTVRMLPIANWNEGEEELSIKVTQTASMLNIIDTEVIPVLPSIPSGKTFVVENNDDDDEPVEKYADMCKLHGSWHSGFVTAHSELMVRSYLINKGAVHFDCYIIWKWDSNDSNEKRFHYAIIHRGLNNFLSTDSQTLLPETDLKFNKYIHSNGNTTIVYNHPVIGPMTWVYDPNYQMKETYYVDPETMDLHVARTKMTYADIDIIPDSSIPDTNIVNTNSGYLNCYVLTTNPISARFDPTDTSSSLEELPLYNQPDLTLIASGNGYSGDNINDFTGSNNYKNLFGNWRLVFPRVNSLSFQNDATNTKWVPMKMQIVKGREVAVGSTTRITDENGNDVTTKNVVITEVVDPEFGIPKFEMIAFNSKTGKWEKI